MDPFFSDNEIVIPEESTSTLIKNYIENSVAADENDFPQFFDSVKTENSGIFDLLQKFVLKSVVVVDGCVQINKSFWKSLDGDELILWKVIRILECNFCRIERLGVDEVFHGVGPFEVYHTNKLFRFYYNFVVVYVINQ